MAPTWATLAKVKIDDKEHGDDMNPIYCCLDDSPEVEATVTYALFKEYTLTARLFGGLTAVALTLFVESAQEFGIAGIVCITWDSKASWQDNYKAFLKYFVDVTKIPDGTKVPVPRAILNGKAIINMPQFAPFKEELVTKNKVDENEAGMGVLYLYSMAYGAFQNEKKESFTSKRANEHEKNLRAGSKPSLYTASTANATNFLQVRTKNNTVTPEQYKLMHGIFCMRVFILSLIFSKPDRYNEEMSRLNGFFLANKKSLNRSGNISFARDLKTLKAAGYLPKYVVDKVEGIPDESFIGNPDISGSPISNYLSNADFLLCKKARACQTDLTFKSSQPKAYDELKTWSPCLKQGGLGRGSGWR